MSRLSHAGVGEDGVNSYQVYKYFRRNAWRDPPVLLEETKCQPVLSSVSNITPKVVNEFFITSLCQGSHVMLGVCLYVCLYICLLAYLSATLLSSTERIFMKIFTTDVTVDKEELIKL